jgi:predicted DsbA family dithiol-disulfide isomerase
MRTHATAIRTTGETVCSSGGGDGGDELASMRTHATAIRTTGAEPSKDKTLTSNNSDKGDFWLPWHIDSQFITLLTSDDFYNETTGELMKTPVDRDNVGLQIMNQDGRILPVSPLLTDDIMLVQMGGFAQIYSGGVLTACRHAVLRRSATPGIARATYCNFWYAPWDEICTLPSGSDRESAINSGWNALMDDSYIDISMMLSFYRFREFFTQVPVGIERHMDGDQFASLTAVLPSPFLSQSGKEVDSSANNIVIDVLTDLRCPFSHIALCRLQQALEQLKLTDRTTIRYHPVFLDPNVPTEGEDLDIYLQREHSMTAEAFYSPEYPLMIAAKEIGTSFHKSRRVVNTLCAFAAINEASKVSAVMGHELFKALSRSYFEEGSDISKLDVICQVATRVGVPLNAAQVNTAVSEVNEEYTTLAKLVSKVPCFVLRRDDATGAGVLMTDPQAVTKYTNVLSSLLQPCTTFSHTHPSGLQLLTPAGVLIAGADNVPVRVLHADPRSPISLHTRARHGFYPSEWPYLPSDFMRADESPDELKYTAPRLVTHMDAPALSALTGLYRCLLVPLLRSTLQSVECVKTHLTLLDTCGSWDTFYPADMLPKGTNIIVQGLNAAELAANTLATQVLVHDLNTTPVLPFLDNSVDFISNVASIEYMKNPVALLAEAHRLLRPGGVLVVAFSNRCFDDKAIAIWLRRIAVGAGIVDLVANWLHFAAPPNEPWAHINSLDLTPAQLPGQPPSDPLYALVAVKDSPTTLPNKCIIN